MRASLVQIGNSRGIRIPKVLLEQTGLRGDVEIEVRGGQLVIRAANPPADREQPTKWDKSEWRWYRAGSRCPSDFIAEGVYPHVHTWRLRVKTEP